jgi:cell division protein FtsL
LALLCGLIFSAIWLLLMRHHARGFYRTWRVD